MAIITRISTQKHNKNCFAVYIDEGHGEQFGFHVDEDVFVQFGLRKGLELSDETIKQILSENEVKKTLKMCYSFLSSRMRSAFEVKNFLRKKAVPEPIIERALEQLEKQQYVNDLQFAEVYVRDKKNLSGKGPLLLEKELKEKGVSETIIQKALMQFPKDEQLEVAKQWMMKKAKQQTKDSYAMFRQKLRLQLQQKGFPHGIIDEALNELPAKNEEMERIVLQKHAEKAHARYKKYTGFEYLRRMKQHLHRKGFSFEQIEQVLEELQREEKE